MLKSLPPPIFGCILVLFLLAQKTNFSLPGQQSEKKQAIITVSVTPGKPANTFIPAQAFGAGVDGHEQGKIVPMLSPANVKAMRSAGFKPLTYRLRTELGIEAWHWNPKGQWSDPAHKQGYWTSDHRLGTPISVCYGYYLPRRGNTIDQANNDGYSRLDDGDLTSFWKSNPYLDRYFSGEDNATHPQWVVIDLGTSQPLNALRLVWGIPYARAYKVEYWNGSDDFYPEKNDPGEWREFPHGKIADGKGGNTLLRLSDEIISARFVRIVMSAASGTAPSGSHDVRDGLGYAIREVFLGRVDSTGQFTDVIKHGKTQQTQTRLYVSSTDPWHRAMDRDLKVEQPGLDLIFRSGLSSGMPVLMSLPLLFDTPENAVALMQYLKARNYPVKRVELGEEPDGQAIAPEDYAALYLQWVAKLHQVTPAVQAGGTSFQSIEVDYREWPENEDGRTWMSRFLDYLRSHQRLADFSFCSFEWYPFDDICAPTAPQLAEAPTLLKESLARLEQSGLSRQLPWLMTEYGYSAFAGEPEVRIEGELLAADIVGQFLTLGGAEAYWYGYEPNELINETGCSWGNNMLFTMDERGKIKHRLATYQGARLLTQQWVEPSNRQHLIYPASSDILNEKNQQIVTAYAVHRPDKKWSLLLINKDPKQAWSVRIQFHNTVTKLNSTWNGPIEVYQYSSAQYAWHPNQEKGHPIRNLPPDHRVLPNSSNMLIELPPYSLSIVRGNGPEE